MNLKLEFSSEEIAAMEARSAAAGLTIQDWIHRLACQELTGPELREPFTSGFGMLSKYGAAPSAEEIDENRREMFRAFAEDFR